MTAEEVRAEAWRRLMKLSARTKGVHDEAWAMIMLRRIEREVENESKDRGGVYRELPEDPDKER